MFLFYLLLHKMLFRKMFWKKKTKKKLKKKKEGSPPCRPGGPASAWLSPAARGSGNPRSPATGRSAPLPPLLVTGSRALFSFSGCHAGPASQPPLSLSFFFPARTRAGKFPRRFKPGSYDFLAVFVELNPYICFKPRPHSIFPIAPRKSSPGRLAHRVLDLAKTALLLHREPSSLLLLGSSRPPW